MRKLGRPWMSGRIAVGLGRNAAWFTAMSVGDRLIALVQTIVVARVLGITEYGAYGLLFGTVGFVASVVGLQMGLTATVFVARYRVTQRARAAAVIGIAIRYGWIVGVLLALAAPACSEPVALILFGSTSYSAVVAVGLVLVGASVIGGIQEGVAQGFEAFGSLARTRVVTSLAGLMLIYPAALHFGLFGVVSTIVLSLVLKSVMLHRAIARLAVESDLPRTGTGVSFRGLVTEFSLPSMAINLGLGFVTWLGMLILSRLPTGLDSVAVVNVGMQWRAPLLLVASSVASVALPVFGRLGAREDHAGALVLRRKLAALSLAVSLIAVGLLAASSSLLLRAYGPEFSKGQLAFCLIVASCIPMVVSQIYVQHLIGAALMWRVFWLNVPHLAVWLTCLVYMVPRYAATGYAVAALTSALVLAATVVLTELKRPADISKLHRADA